MTRGRTLWRIFKKRLFTFDRENLASRRTALGKVLKNDKAEEMHPLALILLSHLDLADQNRPEVAAATLSRSKRNIALEDQPSNVLKFIEFLSDLETSLC